MRDSADSLLASALLVLVGCGLASLAAANPCALDSGEVALSRAEGESGMGGSGFGDEGSGLGGSGAADESGVGGSGLFGTITGFASVCVNGIEVQVGSATALERFGRESSPSQLAVGQVVWIEATGRGGQLHAEHISILTAAAGTLHEIDLREQQLRVADQWIALAPDTEVYDAIQERPAGIGTFAPGEYAVVSGLPGPDGRIVASRIERSTPKSGARADLVSLAELLADSPQVRVVWIEGHLARVDAPDRARVAGTDIDFARPSDISIDWLRDTRVVLSGRVDSSGTVEVDAVQVIPRRTAPVRPPAPERIEPTDTRPDSAEPGASSTGQPAPSGGAPGRVGPSRVNPSLEIEAVPGDRPAVPEQVYKPERPERPKHPERPERPERHERPERPQRPERPDRPERIERPDLPPTIDRP